MIHEIIKLYADFTLHGTQTTRPERAILPLKRQMDHTDCGAQNQSLTIAQKHTQKLNVDNKIPGNRKVPSGILAPDPNYDSSTDPFPSGSGDDFDSSWQIESDIGSDRDYSYDRDYEDVNTQRGIETINVGIISASASPIGSNFLFPQLSLLYPILLY
jgi:hypothetical protein